MITIFCDGACEPKNPGGVPAWGFVIYHDGRWIGEDCGIWGKGETNNIAEYAGLIEAFKYLVDNGLTRERVKVLSDSRLLINQLTGFWGINADHLFELWGQAKDLERKFPKVLYAWIPREQNEYADALSRQAYGESLAGLPALGVLRDTGREGD